MGNLKEIASLSRFVWSPIDTSMDTLRVLLCPMDSVHWELHISMVISLFWVLILVVSLLLFLVCFLLSSNEADQRDQREESPSLTARFHNYQFHSDAIFSVPVNVNFYGDLNLFYKALSSKISELSRQAGRQQGAIERREPLSKWTTNKRVIESYKEVNQRQVNHQASGCSNKLPPSILLTQRMVCYVGNNKNS